MTLYILKYNNYYNRLVKSETNLDEYKKYLIYPQTEIGIIQSVNFNPNDGVDTQHVIGVGEYDGSGDYLITVDEDGQIVSRWFIIDSVRTRAGQYQVQLRRDLIADYINVIKQSPMFIEKCNLDVNSPLIFNKEQDFTVNQILTEQTSLTDESMCAWIVGYYDKDASEISGNVDYNPSTLSSVAINEAIYNALSSGNMNGVASQIGFGIQAQLREFYNNRYVYFEALDNTTLTQNWDKTIPISYGSFPLQFENNPYNKLYERLSQNSLYTSFKENIQAYVTNQTLVTQDQFDSMMFYNGKTVSYDGKFYKVTITFDKDVTSYYSVKSGNLYDKMYNWIKDGLFLNYGNANEGPLFCKVKVPSYKIDMFELSQYSISFDLVPTGSPKSQTFDAPYNIFAIPYPVGPNTLKVVDTLNGGAEYNIDDLQIQINLAQAIRKKGGTKVYDVQLLPYCPLQSLITSQAQLTVDNAQQYQLVKDGSDNVKSIIFYVENAQFHTTSNFSFERGKNSIERKVNNQCDKWRLCSPNYSNYFDFSVEMNDGVDFFDVDCEYKPYTPYIHINPNFKGLYGKDFNDPRGLILGGDFSLTYIVDQWEQYQIQNKNFQQIFDRQKQNLEITQKYQRQSDIINAALGTISGGIAGGMMSSTLFPGKGLAGGIASGILSGIAGIADVAVNEKLRQEALDYQQAMFNYQLGNIQALPDTIGKVSAYNPNNKIFPILEYYTCTDEEKNAFVNKLKWNGMTTMVIGTMEQYMDNKWTYGTNDIQSENYIKGKLIRLNQEFGEDFHIVNSIADELNKGVYIK